jgi:hypothetical protein
MDLYKAEEAHPSNVGPDMKAYFDHNGRIGGAKGLWVSSTSGEKNSAICYQYANRSIGKFVSY